MSRTKKHKYVKYHLIQSESDRSGLVLDGLTPLGTKEKREETREKREAKKERREKRGEQGASSKLRNREGRREQGVREKTTTTSKGLWYCKGSTKGHYCSTWHQSEEMRGRAEREGERGIRLHYEGDCNDAATGSQDTTLLCRGGQPVDNSTRRVLLDLVHTIIL